MMNRIRAFKYAFCGLYIGFKREVHLRIHFSVMVLVILMGYYFNITTPEWIAVLVCSGLVIASELINSAIEKACDLVSKEKNMEIKYVKDVSAAAVLILALMAIVIGSMIFKKYIFSAIPIL